jgi:hypothetical protein
MKRQAAEGLAAVDRASPVNALDRLAGSEPGWDPYEVWRTRVKGSFTEMRERAPDRLSQKTAGDNASAGDRFLF